MMNRDNKIASQINLVKLPLNTTFEFSVDQHTDWVREILMELNEKATEKTPEEYLKETELKVIGEFEKKSKHELQDYFLVRGQVKATYAAECVRTLKPMQVELFFPLKICFIDESYASSELYTDADETWIDNEVYELYFYSKRMIPFQEMLHEQVFLNYEQYPVLDAESKLF